MSADPSGSSVARSVRQDRAMATRRQILLGAAHTFEVTGYDGATLAMIIDVAQVTRGALYFHFRTKDQIGRAIIDEQHAISIQLVTEIGESSAPAIEQVVALCHAMADQIVNDPIVRAGIRLTLEQTFTQAPADPYIGWIDAATALLQRGQTEGDVAASVVARELAAYVIASFTGVQLVAHVLTKREDLHERIDSMWRYLLPGVLSETGISRIDQILGSSR